LPEFPEDRRLALARATSRPRAGVSVPNEHEFSFVNGYLVVSNIRPLTLILERGPRRQKCVPIDISLGMTQRSVALSVANSLVSSVTTPGEPLSVQGNASIASTLAGKAIEHGYFDYLEPSEQTPES
jgi:hypothetical protein